MKYLKSILSFVILAIAVAGMTNLAMAQKEPIKRCSQCGSSYKVSQFPGGGNLCNSCVKKNSDKKKSEEKARKETEKKAKEEAKRKAKEEAKKKKAEETNDPPMFKMEDVTVKKQAGNFTVFLLRDGSVISYNRETGQNTKIHSGGAKDIGFRDTTAGILNIRLSDDTRKIVDLNTGQIVSTETIQQQPQSRP